jgi:hypothetical protein
VRSPDRREKLSRVGRQSDGAANNLNQYPSATLSGQQLTFTPDPNGNLLTAGNFTYTPTTLKTAFSRPRPPVPARRPIPPIRRTGTPSIRPAARSQTSVNGGVAVSVAGTQGGQNDVGVFASIGGALGADMTGDPWDMRTLEWAPSSRRITRAPSRSMPWPEVSVQHLAAANSQMVPRRRRLVVTPMPWASLGPLRSQAPYP